MEGTTPTLQGTKCDSILTVNRVRAASLNIFRVTTPR
jgi:hypothetical protein